jgi:hypothetical protein
MLGLGAAATASLGLAAPANGIDVTSNITTDTTWTKADSPVQLRQPVFVGNGASLTIEAGVTIVTGDNDDGGLVIERDSQIFALGTQEQPIIMTSINDVATWDNSSVQDTDSDGEYEEVTDLGDRGTGTLRHEQQEWRNLTILGNGVIASAEFGGSDVLNDQGNPNTKEPSASNNRQMEGLLSTEGTNPPESVFFGGGDDDDDSGVLRYVSTRYGGRVLGEGNELNGLSLGALGRGTDISFVEVHTNVDDGIELWGGTVDLDHFTVWNVGDDSIDFDEGYRGRMQFGLIVQGYSGGVDKGSGVSDNAFEMDGAEDSDAQPRSTVTVSNVTVIGQPVGSGLTTWRDNARVQFLKSVFMGATDDSGLVGPQPLIELDDLDGDGASGYGYLDADGDGIHDGAPGTHTWEDVWTTPETNLVPNAGAFPDAAYAESSSFTRADLYQSQLSDGISANLAAIQDSVAWNTAGYNNKSDVDEDGTSQEVGEPRGNTSGGVGYNPFTDQVQGANNNVVLSASDPKPVSAITRASNVNTGGEIIREVTNLDPRAANDATDAAGSMPTQDGFWAQADFRGGMSPAHNWADGWTAADAYQFLGSRGGDQRADDPETGFEVQVTTTTFDTKAGETYVIECTTDGTDWEPIKTVEGDGTQKTVADEITEDDNKFYRVRVQ